MSISIRITAKFKGEINGRLLLFIDRPGEHEEEMLYKRSGFGMKGCPVFGVTFYGLKSGDLIELDEQKDKIFGSHFPYEAIPKEKLEESRFYPALLQLAQGVFPHFKELFQQGQI